MATKPSAGEERKKNQAEIKQLKNTEALCIRCPDITYATKCPAAMDENLSGCISDMDAEGLWPGFVDKSPASQICDVDFSDRNQCVGILRKAQTDHREKFERSKKTKHFQDLAKKLREDATYTYKDQELTLTKAILNDAYNTVYPRQIEEVEIVTKKVKETKLDDKKKNEPENKGTLKYLARPERVKEDKEQPKLITNHFPVTLTGTTQLYEYQIDGLISRTPGKKLSSPKKNTIIRRLIETTPALHQFQQSFSFNNEGKIIAWESLDPNITTKDVVVIGNIPVSDFDRTSTNNQPTGQFTLSVVFKRAFSLDSLNNFVNGKNSDYTEVGAGQALDIMFGYTVAQNTDVKTVQIGDNRFFPLGDKQNQFPLSKEYGLEAIRGFSSHVTPVDGSVTLNINTAFSAFYKQQTVQEYMEQIPKDFQHHLRGVRVRIMYDRCKTAQPSAIDSEARRTRTITGFSPLHANKTMFTKPDGQEVSVWSHFENQYSPLTSSAGNQVCVNTSDTAKGNETWFLADQLEVVPGQLYRRTLDPTLTAKMIDFACQSPETNRSAIMKSGLKALGLQNGTPAVLSGAGITFTSEMMQIPFRRISPPSIIYAQGSRAELKDGVWKTRGQQFLSTNRPIEKPVVFFTPLESNNPGMERHYIDCFTNLYKANGIKITGKVPVVSTVQRIETSDPKEIARKIDGTGLAVFVLPDDSPENRKKYAAFRVAADQLLGTPSLVFSEKRIAASSSDLKPYMSSNMMKVNTRIGNSNHAVGILGDKIPKNTLVLGADLIHPKQSNPEDVPSIASLVGSIDNQYATFYGSARRTTHRVEIIDKDTMISMASERIKAYRDLNNKDLPSQIIYYRDGTGQSQYSDILEHEVSAIREAFAKFQKPGDAKLSNQKIKLKITAIVVVKRHTTRFYPTSTSNKDLALKENCRPGTVVDSHITSPYYFDFFLQSHTVETHLDSVTNQKKVGSAKPTHYFVLVDENKFSAVDLQNITNGFCYDFSHSTSPVSYAAPAYLADKLCERASLYLKRWFDGDVEDVKDKDRKGEMDGDWERGRQGKLGNPWDMAFNSRMFWM